MPLVLNNLEGGDRLLIVYLISGCAPSIWGQSEGGVRKIPQTIPEPMSYNREP